MSNITTSHFTRQSLTPVYDCRGKKLKIKGVIYPRITVGKLITIMILMLMLALPIIALLQVSTPEPQVSGVSGISENLKK